MSPIRLRRFFHRVDSGYQVNKTIRDLCVFSTQNVFSDPPFSRVDLVSCRNVMIYLSQALQRRVIPVFHYALNPDGFLMIGNTEGLLGSGAEVFDTGRQKAEDLPQEGRQHSCYIWIFRAYDTNECTMVPAATVAARPAELPRVAVDLQREADRLLLARYAPPSVVVNDDLEIVQIKGRTGPFLELPTGRPALTC